MFYIISKTPNPSGAYPPIQSWETDAPIPEGYALVGETLNTDIFYQYNGFVSLVFDEENILVGFTPNVEAWKAWKATRPEPVEPEPELTAEAVAAAIMEGVNNI